MKTPAISNGFIVITTLFSIGNVLAIRCFQCNSYEDPVCADLSTNDTSSKYFKECDADAPGVFCRKTIQTILDSKEPPRVTRACGWFVHKGRTSNCRLSDTDYKLEKSCQCFEDGCNGAPSWRRPSASALLPIAILPGLVLAYRPA